MSTKIVVMEVIRHTYSINNPYLTEMCHRLELFLERYVEAVFVSLF